MKNYKFILIILSFITLGFFMLVTYVDMPAPDKLQKTILDVNDDKVK